MSVLVGWLVGCQMGDTVADSVESLHKKAEGCGFHVWWGQRNFPVI